MNKRPVSTIGGAVSGLALLVLVWLSLSLASGWASAQAQLPPAVVLATHGVGTGFHADGSVIAKMISDRSPMTMVVRPHPGPPAWLPSMNGGEIEFGVLTGVDSASAFRGVGAYRRANPNIRLVMVGAPLTLAWWASAESGMKTVADLKGKRLPSGWKGLPVIHFSTQAALASTGLTLDDVVRVPVAELGENVRAFLEGRTDAMWHSVGAPAVQEANARIRGGIRMLAIGTSQEGLRRMAELLPGTYKLDIKKGSSVGVLDDTPVAANDIYIVAPVSLSENVVEAFLKIVWDQNDELRKVTPRMRQWTRERMASAQATIPYHAGAIKFYREKGVWSAEMDKHQQQAGKP